eukprot:GFKZ01009636.1.p1 GENE.GFKZ01009636.1~~GFKZ01009636.1.p1  ORF type:complete len:409 (-),score=51.28 GFKZ01009636.1:700-1926(-)
MAPPSPAFVTAVAASPFLPPLPLPSRCRRLPASARSVRSSRPSTVCCTSSPPAQDLESLLSTVESKLVEATSAVTEATDDASVDKVRVAFLGKKGSITSIMKLVGKLAQEDRPVLGAAVNKAKDALTEHINARREEIEMEENRKQEESEWLDVTMPGIRPKETVGRIHPITSTMDLATDVFLNLGYDLIDDPEFNREIETDYYCFEALNCPPGHPARDMQDTFYLKEDQSVLLRTQTSAVQIRYMEKNKPPFKIIAPGRVYRRDTVDSTHSATFHQIEILAIDEMGKLDFGTLRATMIHFLEQMLGDGIKTRFRGSYFPFTEPSVEVDVFFKGKWLEVLGCGMVDPAVLENVGLDPEKWSGFAAGFGVERFAMVMHGLTDIRELYRNDVRFLSQFMIDSPWKDWKEFL